MRKLSLLAPAALLAGIVGAVLRAVELRTVFDPASGLPETDAPVSLTLAILTVAVVIAAAVLAFRVNRKNSVPAEYHRAFKTRGYPIFAAQLLLSLVPIACAVVLAVGGGSVMGLNGLAKWVFLIFLILTGSGTASMSYASYTGREGPALRLGCVVPALFYCYWMVALYRVNAGNPVLIDYCYGCMAFAAAAMGFYYTAGFAYGRRSLFGAVAVDLVAIFLLTVTLADPMSMPLRLTAASTALYLTLNTSALLSTLTPKTKNPRRPQRQQESS